MTTLQEIPLVYSVSYTWLLNPHNLAKNNPPRRKVYIWKVRNVWEEEDLFQEVLIWYKWL